MDYAKHLRVAIYARVSTPNQAERDLSVPEQIESVRAFCKKRGWPVVAEFKDEGISGKNQVRRLEFIRMLELGKQKHRTFDIVLTRDHSRFGRSDEDNVHRNNLRKYGCRVDNIDEPYGDISEEGITAAGRTMERHQTTADIGMREKVGPLVYKSQRRKAEQGGLPGSNGTMFGYQSFYEGAGPKPTRHVVLNPETAPIATDMFRRYADGESLHSLTKWLNESGVPTTRNGERWWAANVRRILTNETALGRIAYGRTKTTFDPETEMPRHLKSDKEPARFDGAFPPLVTQEVFDAVQVRLQKNERRRPKGGHPDNLVRGIAYCAKCGWGLSFMERSHRWYYMCESKKQKGAKADDACRGTLPATHMHAVVIDFLKHHVAVPHYQLILKEAVRAYNNAASEHRGLPEIEILAAQIRKLESQRANFLDAIGDGELASVRERLQETELRLLAARKRSADLAFILRSIPKLDEQHILDVAKGLRSAITSNDLPKIKEFLGSVVSRIEVDLTKRQMREITFNIKRTEPNLQEVLKTQFPGAKITPLDKLDEETLKAMGGREAVNKLTATLQEPDKDVLQRIAPAFEAMKKLDLKAARLGVSIEQGVDQGRITTVLSKGAPLTFITKWDAANLDQLSAEALRKIGSIAT